MYNVQCTKLELWFPISVKLEIVDNFTYTVCAISSEAAESYGFLSVVFSTALCQAAGLKFREDIKPHGTMMILLLPITKSSCSLSPIFTTYLKNNISVLLTAIQSLFLRVCILCITFHLQYNVTQRLL